MERLPSTTRDTWEILEYCLDRLKTEKSWINLDDYFKNRLCDDCLFFPALKIYVKSFSISNIELIENAVEILVRNKKKGQATELCNTILLRGIYVDDIQEIIQKRIKQHDN